MPPEIKFHKEVVALLDDFQALEGGPRLSAENLRKWTDAVSKHARKETICDHLIVLAMRFMKAKAYEAMQQLVGIVVAAIGGAKAQAALVEGGVASERAKELVAQTNVTTASLSGGLAAPKKTGPGAGAPMGVGLRKKR